MRGLFDLTDTRYRHAINLNRKFANILRAHSEQQFEVFAPVKGQHQWIERATSAEIRNRLVNRKLVRLHQCANLTFSAEMV